ncbi:uncharacterized protein LOC131233636 isoform X1 [Magnolia sinica]|uniref:uncharacterized protein LOC131233636 isoform X1 n=1 Tax=Magnolia sinica TaxID=86752 RepID=UPI002659A68F|nr:uncharacterized protein LOC131233636 isoform X1 [Magnolia sinica]
MHRSSGNEKSYLVTLIISGAISYFAGWKKRYLGRQVGWPFKSFQVASMEVLLDQPDAHASVKDLDFSFLKPMFLKHFKSSQSRLDNCWAWSAQPTFTCIPGSPASLVVRALCVEVVIMGSSLQILIT